MDYTSTTWDDAITFYKKESKADHDLRAIAGKWMHKFAHAVSKDAALNTIPIALNGWTLVFEIPDSPQNIYAFCEKPGRITFYLDHCGESLETFFGEHQTVEVEDAHATLHNLIVKGQTP